MEEIPKQLPKIFRVQTTDSLLYAGCLTFFVSTIIGIFLGAFLNSLLFPPSSNISLTILCSVSIAIVNFFSIRMVYRQNHTKARIELLANKISLYDAKGILVVSEDLSQLACGYNSRLTTGSRGGSIDYFHLLFMSGNLITFNQYLENNFTLEKMLKSRMGHDFERITWTDYHMLESESVASRAEKAKCIPKPVPKEIWDPR